MTSIPFEELAKLIGEKNAMRLARFYGGRKVPSAVDVLRARRRAAIVADWFKGAQIAEISAKYNMPPARVKALLTTLLKEKK